MTEPHTHLGMLIGHEVQRRSLEQLIRSGQVPHAMLFAGPEGVGKLFCARQFCRDLLSKTTTKESSATKLKKTVDRVHTPDLHIISQLPEKRDIAVDQVRDLLSALSLKPYLGHGTCAIINNAHLLSNGAANALLKTLEEPTPGTVIILVTAAPLHLPETILSRCQNLEFGTLNSQETEQILTELVHPLGFKSDEISQLLTLCTDSLAAMQFDSLLDPGSGEWLDADEAGATLRAVTGEQQRLIQQIDILLHSAEVRPQATDRLLSALSDLGGENSNRDLIWGLLRGRLRERLITAKPHTASCWAQMLLDTLLAESQVRERNLNFVLALSDVFLHR